MNIEKKPKIACTLCIGLMFFALKAAGMERGENNPTKSDVSSQAPSRGNLLAKLSSTDTNMKPDMKLVKSNLYKVLSIPQTTVSSHSSHIPTELTLVEMPIFSIAIDTNLAVVTTDEFSELQGLRSATKILFLAMQVIQEAAGKSTIKEPQRCDPAISSHLAAIDFSYQTGLSLVPILGARVLARF